MSRVLITGRGAVCGAGLGLERVMESILEGRSAVGAIQGWDTTGWPIGVAAELRGVATRELVPERKLHKTIGRTDLLGLFAAEAALTDASYEEARAAQTEEGTLRRFEERSGVFSGCGGGTYDCNYDFLPLLDEVGGDLGKFGRELGSNVSPLWLLRILPNNVICHLGIRHGLRGINGCVTNEGVSGAQAVAEAVAAIRSGGADRMLAVGHAASIVAENVLRYHSVGLLSRTAVRSFDRDRDGTVVGEGAGALLLESEASAAGRGAHVLGEFLGSGCVSEATGVLPIRPDGDGARRAIELALKDAGLEPDAVGMIVAHGNGTLDSDASEALALAQIFGDAIPPVTGFKWATGHLLAASGALDLVLALECLRRAVVPGIATLEHLDAEFSSLPVSRDAREPIANVALVSSRGFGGMNVAQLVRAEPTRGEAAR